MKKNERYQAACILKEVLQHKTPLSHALKKNESVSPLTKEICFGVLRHYLHLEKLATTLLNKKPKDFDIWILILMGIYQLAFLRIPEYATVHETVGLLASFKKAWAKGLVNAVLRRYGREYKQHDMNTFAASDNHPAWLLKKLQHHWPDDWQAILKANDAHAPMSLRVNQRHTNTEDYLARLQALSIKAKPHPVLPYAVILETPVAVKDLPGFQDGDVTVQDCAAQLAATLVAPLSNQRVLDACCAPGGKTTHLLECAPDLKMCLALDIDNTRLARVQENLTRLKLSATLQQADILKPNDWWDGIPFDRILLDAPCSATGVIRRHPDIKLLRTDSDIQQVAMLQQQMLDILWPMLLPGGRLIYATCSVMPEENEQQIAQFKRRHSDCEIDTTSKPWGRWTGHGWQILPGEQDMDGFFYSVLIRTQTK